MTKLERIGVAATGPLQMLLTAASMVGCINAIVGGVAVALALVGLGLAALCFGYQVRRFRRAAAVVPELYEGQSPGMPGWTERVDRQER
jgi:hypothetical protein